MELKDVEIIKLIDLTGQRFGRLTVVKQGPHKVYASGKRIVAWICLCDCGKDVLVSGEVLRREHGSKSCGCYSKELQRVLHTTHGLSKSKLYNVWRAIKSRCTNPNDSAYANYGGRGIRMCDEWYGDYTIFHKWATANGYDESLSIDRIDVNGNYCPENCRWVNEKEQANNRRTNRLITHNGETHNVTEWAEIPGVSSKTIFTRIYEGWDPEKAIIF